MSVIQAFILGMVQGLTEFLPVSSSGHLVLVEGIMPLTLSVQDLMGFDILLHAGTLIALILCYPTLWKKICLSPFNGDRQHQRLLLFIVIATIPAVFAGLFLKEWIEGTLRTSSVVGLEFIINGIILLIAERAMQKKSFDDMNARDGLLVGIAQAFALSPGLSRSALTISAARLLGYTRPVALDFSFLIATPAIAGAVILTLIDLYQGEVTLPGTESVIAGFISALIFSCIAIVTLRKFVAKHSLAWFAVYLLPLGVILLIRS